MKDTAGVAGAADGEVLPGGELVSMAMLSPGTIGVMGLEAASEMAGAVGDALPAAGDVATAA
eukprot:CAMPEP_0202913762 /NCGR_PEP_ID=MMETSP1392-20130828/61446_1 /ASSEMBLY_ACC=CAM_ASM_000868 /TAXON_ID=225041 /ORGANISM="Chlamydomonas chlamydogama, Strain SAG 11-48b" /LENGTH=61 /DNA_ID=CAMNT_0049605169 /DNA_START=190 /DNA_END=371 /DNA_ORIENTATION=-